METKRCISSLTLEQLTAELKAMGQPGFRAKQIFHWEMCIRDSAPSASSTTDNHRIWLLISSIIIRICQFCKKGIRKDLSLMRMPANL